MNYFIMEKGEIVLKIVKDKIMYQATNWDYKVGQKIYFGKKRTFHSYRVFEKTMDMKDGTPAATFAINTCKNKSNVSTDEFKQLTSAILDYSFCLRELATEDCRKKYFKNYPSKLTCMYLCEKEEYARNYLVEAQEKNNRTQSKIVKVKLNGKLFKATKNFNRRDLSYDGFFEEAKKYWQGVDESVDNDRVEFLFEGWAEIVDIID